MPIDRLLSSGSRSACTAAFEAARRLGIHFACNLVSPATALRASHGMLVFFEKAPSAEQGRWIRMAEDWGIPVLAVELGPEADPDIAAAVRSWRIAEGVRALFVEGPEESEAAGRIATILLLALEPKPHPHLAGKRRA